MIRAELTGLDDVDLVDGIPVGVQIIAGKYGDEKCIAVGKVIEELLKSSN